MLNFGLLSTAHIVQRRSKLDARCSEVQRASAVHYCRWSGAALLLFLFSNPRGQIMYPLARIPAALLDTRARRDPLRAWSEIRRCVAIIRVGGEEL